MSPKVKRVTMITMNTKTVQRMAMAESDLELCKMTVKHLEKQMKGYKKEVKELGKMAIEMGKDIEKLSKLNARKTEHRFSPEKSKSKSKVKRYASK